MYSAIDTFSTFSNIFNKSNPKNRQSKLHNTNGKESLYDCRINWDSLKLILTQFKKIGRFTMLQIEASGFTVTEDGIAACCKECGLEISDWTSDINLIDFHRKQKPTCRFIQNISSSMSWNTTSTSAANTAVSNTSELGEHENPSNRQKIDAIELDGAWNKLWEAELMVQARRRSFSHWPHRTTPSSAQMITAGFFNCNVHDRVICIYCNLICQHWTHEDDPSEVHKIISPKCIYVQTKLIGSTTSPKPVLNNLLLDIISGKHFSPTLNLVSLKSNGIVVTDAYHPAYAELPKRYQSFKTWPKENRPSVDDLVRAGFFYTGTNDVVTCFYCDKSLQGWNLDHNPMIIHAYYYPFCAYAKQLCGDKLYQEIQESNRTQQKSVLDDNTLSRMVAARLDLPISQRLSDKNFKLSIIKRCWENQLRLNQNDFVSDCDLYMACLVLQKQIEHIDENKENIIIPNIKMLQIQNADEKGIKQQNSSSRNTRSFILNHADTI